MVPEAFGVVLLELRGAVQALVTQTAKKHQSKRAVCGEKHVISNVLEV
jgi:hypothetical protein